jgi:hypothetical protein
MVKRSISRMLVVLCVGYVLTGCVATMPTADGRDPRAPDSYEQYMADAEQKLKAGQRESAVAALSEAAKVAPTRKEPWLRMAQIHFDTANHGQAITAAQEVLLRDVADKGARSILAVSGLRVSVKALSELRADNALSADARSEAESLARTLRDTLGAAVLVPASGNSAGSGASSRPGVAIEQRSSSSAGGGATSGAVPAAGGSGTPSARPKTPSRPAAPTGGANPFGSLK